MIKNGSIHFDNGNCRLVGMPFKSKKRQLSMALAGPGNKS